MVFFFRKLPVRLIRIEMTLLVRLLIMIRLGLVGVKLRIFRRLVRVERSTTEILIVICLIRLLSINPSLDPLLHSLLQLVCLPVVLNWVTSSELTREYITNGHS